MTKNEQPDGDAAHCTDGIERKRPRGEDVGRRWDRKASENMACWGIQHPQEVLSAIDEEVAAARNDTGLSEQEIRDIVKDELNDTQ